MAEKPKLLNIEEARSFDAVGNYIWKKTNGNKFNLVSISELVENIEYNDNVKLSEWEVRKTIDRSILAKVLEYNSAADKVAIADVVLAKIYFETKPGVSYPSPLPCPRCHNVANYVIIANASVNSADASRFYSCSNVLCGFHEQFP